MQPCVDPLDLVLQAPYVSRRTLHAWGAALETRGDADHAVGYVLVLDDKLDRMGYTGAVRLVSHRKRKLTEDDVRAVTGALDASADDGRGKLRCLRALLKATTAAVVDVFADDGMDILLPPVLAAWADPLDYPAFVRMSHGVNAKLRAAPGDHPLQTLASSS